MSEQVEVTELPKCDFCYGQGYVDGQTVYGRWGIMCKVHFAMHGVGLGTGKGQRLVLKTEEEE